MKKTIIFLLLCLSGIMMVSCRKDNKSNVIIARKPIVVHKQVTQKTGDGTKSMVLHWLGGDYTLTVTTKADPSLRLATDGNTKYYDNRITLNIVRADGSEFFNRTFTKADFRNLVDDAYYKDGALIAIVFDKVDGNLLHLSVSVGNPDKSSDEFVPLDMTVNNFGAVNVSKVDADEE